VLFCFLHGEQVFDDLPVTPTTAIVAKLINREMDAVLSDTVEMKKNSSEVLPIGKMGSKATGTMASNE